MKKLSFYQGSYSVGELFHLTQSRFFFSRNNNKYAFVKPYCIITDGYDLIGFISNSAQIDIGISFEVNRPKKLFIKKTPVNFGNIIEQAVTKKFFDIFEVVHASNVLETNNSPVIEDKQYVLRPIKFSGELLNIHKTFKAIYSIDKKSIYIPYFVILPNLHSIRLKLKDENYQIAPIPIVDYLKTGLTKYRNRMHYVSMAISFMLAVGEIMLPIKRNEIKINV
jgi:hypothetical protein